MASSRPNTLMTLVDMTHPPQLKLPSRILKTWFISSALTLHLKRIAHYLRLWYFLASSMTMSIPPTKLEELLSKIKKVYLESHTSKHQLQSLCSIALCQFITFCVPQAWIFMASLLDGLHSFPRHGCIQISDIIKSDLQWCLCFLPHYNGVSIILLPAFTPNVIITDPCFHGADGYFRHE